MFSEIGLSWERFQGGQMKGLHQCMKSLTVGLSQPRKEVCRLADWCREDTENECLVGGCW